MPVRAAVLPNRVPFDIRDVLFLAESHQGSGELAPIVRSEAHAVAGFRFPNGKSVCQLIEIGGDICPMFFEERTA